MGDGEEWSRKVRRSWHLTCTLESAWDLDILHAENGISSRGNNRNEDSDFRSQVLSLKETSIHTINRETNEN